MAASCSDAVQRRSLERGEIFDTPNLTAPALTGSEADNSRAALGSAQHTLCMGTPSMVEDNLQRLRNIKNRKVETAAHEGLR